MTEIWKSIREKFPPARAVAVLTVLVSPLLGIINGWLANHAPLIAEQVGPNQISAIVLGTIGAAVLLAYKWLDGRAKWEAGQINATVSLVNNDKLLLNDGVSDVLPQARNVEGQAKPPHAR